MNTILLQAAEQFIENLNIILHRSHYEVSGSLNENGDDFAIIFSVSYNGSEEETMPTIELGFDRYLNQDDHEMWAAVPTLTFPTLSYSIENDYADTIQYHLDQWANLGENITDINRADFDFTEFSEQQNEVDNIESATDFDDEYQDLGQKAEKLTGIDEWEITHLIRESHQIYSFDGSGTITSLKLNKDKTKVEITLHLEGYYDSDEDGDHIEIDDDFTCEFPVVNNDEDVISAFTDFYDDDDESEESMWKELSSKMVPDSDGFYTDYTLYESTDPEATGCAYICMFGDKDVYQPDAGYADMEFDDLSEAEDWFYSYQGLLDEDEIFSSEDIDASVSIREMMSTISRQSPRRAPQLKNIAHEHGLDVDNIIYFYTSMNDTLGNTCVGIEYVDGVCGYLEHGDENRCTFDEMIEHIYQHFDDSEVDESEDILSSDEMYDDEDEFVDLTPEMFYSFFDATVDDETKDLAAKILCKWYMLEGAEELPTKTDILDMVDAADSEEDAAIVLTALGKF